MFSDRRLAYNGGSGSFAQLAFHMEYHEVSRGTLLKTLESNLQVSVFYFFFFAVQYLSASDEAIYTNHLLFYETMRFFE